MERAEVGEQGRRRVPAGPGRVAPGECVREGLQEVAAREAVEGARRHRLEIEITKREIDAGLELADEMEAS